MEKVETGISENGFTQIVNSKDFEGKEIATKGAYTLLMVSKNKSEE